MPSNVILKPDPDVDFYVVWIETGGGPGLWGTREQCTAAMTRPSLGFTDDDRNPARFDRADTAGTSLLNQTGPFLGKVVGGDRWMPRERMADWCRSMLDARFLEPIDALPRRSTDDRRRAAAADAMDYS